MFKSLPWITAVNYFNFSFSYKDDISLAVLLTFCSEGDNISDAVNLFLYVNDWLKMVPRSEVCKQDWLLNCSEGIFTACDILCSDRSLTTPLIVVSLKILQKALEGIGGVFEG